MQLTASAFAAGNPTDPSAGTKCAANERAWFTDQVIDLLLVFLCRLAEAQAETTGLPSHAESISPLCLQEKISMPVFDHSLGSGIAA
ncbi:MAG TPA: hypothetical protein VJ801_13790, partial [Polyangia bacterium]|nr:hypothetical protein [Polyangia bacterium]